MMKLGMTSPWCLMYHPVVHQLVANLCKSWIHSLFFSINNGQCCLVYIVCCFKWRFLRHLKAQENCHNIIKTPAISEIIRKQLHCRQKNNIISCTFLSYNTPSGCVHSPPKVLQTWGTVALWDKMMSTMPQPSPPWSPWRPRVWWMTWPTNCIYTGTQYEMFYPCDIDGFCFELSSTIKKQVN